METDTKMLERQRAYFASGRTKPIAFRLEQLKKLRDSIQRHEQEVLEALRQDLHKSAFEGYATEVGLVYEELNGMKKHLRRWVKPKRRMPSIVHFPASGRIYREPYGSVLIMSPWNYPFQLTMMPLIGAIAAGNCAVVKPSAYAPHTADVVKTILEDCFDPAYVAVVLGGREENKHLLEEHFDYIFFTGSPTVGKVVMEAAAKHLTPVTLELGGKSPCIVDETADLPLAAKRIVWGKLLNAGQTCIAPDYLLVHEAVKEPFLAELNRQITAAFGAQPLDSEDLPKIINEKHFARLRGLMDSGTIVVGGQVNEQTLQIAPTVLDGVSWDSPIMQEEIFGPLFPVLTFENFDAMLQEITSRPKPLALYLFTASRAREKQTIDTVSFGGGTINDTIVHIASSTMPFGGVGNSGMGQYHGKASFETFTHPKTVVRRGTWLDIPLRYPPYGNRFQLLKKIMK